MKYTTKHLKKLKSIKTVFLYIKNEVYDEKLETVVVG